MVGNGFESRIVLLPKSTSITGQTSKKNKPIHCTKNHIFFFQMFWKHGLSKKIALEYDLSCIIRKDGFFPRKYDLILRYKRKDDLSQKIAVNMIFFRCSRKMVFPGNSRPNTTFFVISGKMVFIFSRNMIFFGRKMKEDDFYHKARGNIVFSVYMRTGTSTALGPQQKKKRYPCPKKYT